jgi:hypothetical protein
LACHLQIDADPHSAPDPAYHFDADQDPDFYLMRIQVIKIMWIRIHNTAPNKKNLTRSGHPYIFPVLLLNGLCGTVVSVGMNRDMPASRHLEIEKVIGYSQKVNSLPSSPSPPPPNKKL